MSLYCSLHGHLRPYHHLLLRVYAEPRLGVSLRVSAASSFCEHLEMVGVADTLFRIDIDPNCRHHAILWVRIKSSGISLQSVRLRSFCLTLFPTLHVRILQEVLQSIVAVLTSRRVHSLTRSSWSLFAEVSSNLPMMDWSESSSFSMCWRAACARCVHEEVKEKLATGVDFRICAAFRSDCG